MALLNELSRAVSQLPWTGTGREEWFFLEKNHEKYIASIYTHCETALAAMADVHDIPVLDPVFLALQPQRALRAGGGF
jgi:hypothetical protein